MGIQARAARSAGQALYQLLAAEFSSQAGQPSISTRFFLASGQAATERLFVEAIQGRMVGLSAILWRACQLCSSGRDVLLGLTDLNAGEEAVEAEATQQVAGDQGNPCLFLRLEVRCRRVTGISAVEGETLTQHIVSEWQRPDPETEQQWGLEA